MELPAVGVGELGEGSAVAGLGPGQHRIGHRFPLRFHMRPPGGCNTKRAADSSLNSAAARGFNCRTNRQQDRRLTMAPVSPPSDPTKERRRIASPSHLGASLRAQTAHEIDSEEGARRWRAFALLVVAYFMTIV